MDNATKQTIDAFLTDRFDHLNRVADFITRRTAPDLTEREELFSHLVEHLYTNPRVPAVAAQGPTNLEGYAVMVMKNAWSWGSTHNQIYRKRVSGEQVEKACVDREEVEVEDQEEPVLTPVQVARLMDVEAAYHLLKPHEKKLYKLYHEDNMSIRKIAAMFCISGNAVRNRVVVMNKKLKGEIKPVQVARLMDVEAAYLLEPHEKKLYKLYYEDNLSIRKIAAMHRISGNAVHKMLAVMRKKLNGEPVGTYSKTAGKENINKLT